MRIRDRLLLAVIVASVVPISYGLALTNHPASLWLWRDIFGVLP